MLVGGKLQIGSAESEFARNEIGSIRSKERNPIRMQFTFHLKESFIIRGGVNLLTRQYSIIITFYRSSSHMSSRENETQCITYNNFRDNQCFNLCKCVT